MVSLWKPSVQNLYWINVVVELYETFVSQYNPGMSRNKLVYLLLKIYQRKYLFVTPNICLPRSHLVGARDKRGVTSHRFNHPYQPESQPLFPAPDRYPRTRTTIILHRHLMKVPWSHHDPNYATSLTRLDHEQVCSRVLEKLHSQVNKHAKKLVDIEYRSVLHFVIWK